MSSLSCTQDTGQFGFCLCIMDMVMYKQLQAKSKQISGKGVHSGRHASCQRGQAIFGCHPAQGQSQPCQAGILQASRSQYSKMGYITVLALC